MTAPPLVQAHDLHVHYGASHVLRGVDMAIQSGEAVGLLGRNGMGKTTLIRSLVGLLRPTRGSVRVQGQPAGAAHAIARQGLAYVPKAEACIPTSVCVRTCWWQPVRANGGPGTTSACSKPSPGWPSGLAMGAINSRLASSKCWPSDAH